MEATNEQYEYLRTFYPHKKLLIPGYGTRELDILSNSEDIDAIVVNNTIRCAQCKEQILDDWILLLHNPKRTTEPIHALFFCSHNNNLCGRRWAEDKQRKDVSNLNTD